MIKSSPAHDAIDLADLPNIAPGALHKIDVTSFADPDGPTHPPRILMLYGSLRETSYSRLSAEEGARVLRALGCEVKFFHPSGLPLPDDASAEHPKVVELRDLVMWSEGMVWSSPERHGAMTGWHSPDTGQNAGGDAGVWWLAIV